MKYRVIKEKILLFFGLLFFLNPLIASNNRIPNLSSSTLEDPNICINDTTRDWSKFKNQYGFKNVYLVFAGPYPSSPSSSFGHLFLLFEPMANQKKPLPLWDAVNFSADVESVGSIEKFYKGIFGGLFGTYKIIPFYEKIREYTFIESRPLWIFPLKIEYYETDLLLYNLFKLNKRTFHYRFHDKNCASQIESLLNKNQSLNRFLTSPREVLASLANRLEKPMYIESVESVLRKNIVNKSLYQKFNDEDGIKGSEAAILLTILEWKYFRRNTMLDKFEKKQLQNLRLAVAKSKNMTNIDLRNFDKEFNMHPPIKYGFGIQFKNSKATEYLFQFRFGLHEFSDNNDVFPKYDFLSLAKISFGLRNKKLHLNELWLFDQISTIPQNSITDYLSWRLAIGVEKKIEYKREPLATGFYSGVGITFPFAHENLNVTFLLNLNTVYLQDYGYTILFGPEVISTLFFSQYFKMKIGFSTISKFLKHQRFEPLLKSNFVLNVTKNFQTSIKTNFSQNGFCLNFSILGYIN